MIKTLFYKTAKDFSEEYNLNFEYVKDILKDTENGAGLAKASVLGMTELDLLKKLDLFQVNLISELEDPRRLVYILYII